MHQVVETMVSTAENAECAVGLLRMCYRAKRSWPPLISTTVIHDVPSVPITDNTPATPIIVQAKLNATLTLGYCSNGK